LEVQPLLQAIKAIIYRNQISDIRAYPWTFTLGHLLNSTYIILVSFFTYHYLIQGQLDSKFSEFAGTNDYLTYVIIGGLLSTISVSMMMNVSRSLITEWREGTLEVLMLSPAKRSSYFIGTAIQQLYRVVIELLPALIIAFFLGLKLTNPDPSAIFGFLLFMISCFSIALVLAGVMLYTRDTYFVQNNLFTVTGLVCGFVFPIEYLPVPLQWISKVFPITDSVFLFRDSMLTGMPIWESPLKIMSVLGLSFIYILIGAYMIKYAERTVFDRSIA
jgi:ABC-2 type transport system permease protein